MRAARGILLGLALALLGGCATAFVGDGVGYETCSPGSLNSGWIGDTILLIPGIWPGVVAWAVDLSSGAIHECRAG